MSEAVAAYTHACTLKESCTRTIRYDRRD